MGKAKERNTQSQGKGAHANIKLTQQKKAGNPTHGGGINRATKGF